MLAHGCGRPNTDVCNGDHRLTTLRLDVIYELIVMTKMISLAARMISTPLLVVVVLSGVFQLL